MQWLADSIGRVNQQKSCDPSPGQAADRAAKPVPQFGRYGKSGDWLGQRRALGLIGPDLMTLKASDGERHYQLLLATGDRVRLFRSVGAREGERWRPAGTEK